MSAGLGAEERPTAPLRPLAPAGFRRRRTATVVVDVLAVAGLIGTVVAVVVGVRAWLDLVDRTRRAVGDEPPVDGVDWVIVVALVLTAGLVVGALLVARAVVVRRHRRRLAQVLGDGARALGRGPRAGLDRGPWLADLLATPGWAPVVAEWERTGAVAPGVTSRLGSGRDPAAVAELVAAELATRVGARSLATGLAVAAARSRVGDAAAVIAGSAEIQLDALATLGLRPTDRTYLRIARSAAAGITAASYLDIEDRLELDLAVRAAVFGLEGAAEVADLADDLISDDLVDALGETLTAGGGTVGTVLGLVGGAFGVSGSVLRQVADVTEVVGTQITEGLVIAALLHHQGMTLVAEVVAGRDDALRERLTPPAGKVPRQLFDAGVAIARRYRADLRKLLRERAARATRSAPKRMSPWRRRTTTEGSDT